MENLVAPAPKLFGNEIVRRRNGPQWKWRQWSCSAEKSWTLMLWAIHYHEQACNEDFAYGWFETACFSFQYY